MTLTPRRYARYRTADGRRQDIRHYDDDTPAFMWAGQEWNRTAVTTREYSRATLAEIELDAIEREHYAANSPESVAAAPATPREG